VNPWNPHLFWLKSPLLEILTQVRNGLPAVDLGAREVENLLRALSYGHFV
jgi:hypothetical protein